MICSMNFSSQNVLNFLFLNAVPGSVLVFLGIPFFAIYTKSNSITFSVVGLGKNNASGQLEGYLEIPMNTLSLN